MNMLFLLSEGILINIFMKYSITLRNNDMNVGKPIYNIISFDLIIVTNISNKINIILIKLFLSLLKKFQMWKCARLYII